MTAADTAMTGSRIGEVVEASTSQFTVQCYDLYGSPPLGSLVRCGPPEASVYGIVCEVVTRGVDPGRRSTLRGREVEDEDAVYRDNPQLARLLSTEFSALAVGYRDGSALHRWLAPDPPRIHAFVYACEASVLRELSASLDFAPVLLSAPIVAADDVLAAFLKSAAAVHPDPVEFLVDAGQQLTPMLGGQMQRLNGILRRMAPHEIGRPI